MTKHLGNLQIMFELLKLHQLVAKGSKYVFGSHQVEYLDHVISQEGVSINSKKIQVVIDWLEPNSVKQLSWFLGLIGYYKWFVKGY